MYRGISLTGVQQAFEEAGQRKSWNSNTYAHLLALWIGLGYPLSFFSTFWVYSIGSSRV
jgi:hypothetical protein